MRSIAGGGWDGTRLSRKIADQVAEAEIGTAFKPFCDFYSPSRIQRGDLLVTVSTNGKSPRLAGRIRRAIESWLVPEWAERLEELAAQRGIWRMERAGMQKLKELTDKYIDDRKWLP